MGEESEERSVVVEVVEAAELPPTDFLGRADPYVKIFWGGNSFKTHVRPKTLEPKWRRKFALSFPDSLPTNEMYLRLKVKDYDRFRRNDLMGSLEVNLTNPTDLPTDRWYELAEGKGCLRLRFNLIGFPLPESGDAARIRADSTDSESSLDSSSSSTFDLLNLTKSMAKLPATSEKLEQKMWYSYSTLEDRSQLPKPAVKAAGIQAIVPSEDQGSHPVGTVDSVLAILQLFPQYDFRTLLRVLKKNGYDKEKSIDELMEALQVVANSSVQSQKLFSSAVLGVFGDGVTSTFEDYVQGHPVPVNQSCPNRFHSAMPTLSHSPKPTPSGRRKALLVGINYTSTKYELRGCIQDVERVKKLLTHIYGFIDCSSNMLVLTDHNENKHYQPTRQNLLYAMQWLSHDAKEGDVLFFHFSGHGSQCPDTTGDEADGLDETILPMDWQTAGAISDDLLSDLLVYPLRNGVKLTAIMDCCHSGTGMDLPFTFDSDAGTWCQEARARLCVADVQLISGCRSDQTSADLQGQGWGAGGALTLAILAALSSSPFGFSYGSLLGRLKKLIAARGFQQQPQLSSSQMFSGSRPFSFDEIVANSNEYVGCREAGDD